MAKILYSSLNYVSNSPEYVSGNYGDLLLIMGFNMSPRCGSGILLNYFVKKISPLMGLKLNSASFKSD
jgi:hypothetical protein